MCTRATRGLTLSETVIGAGVLTILCTSIFALMASSTQLYSSGTSLANLQQQARRVLDDLANELRSADLATMSITTANGASQVQFVKCTGFSGSAPTWSSTIIVNYQLSAVDANDNGVQDEGRIVRTENGSALTLCHYVNSGGFTLTRTGNNLTLSLTLIGRDEDGRALQATLNTSITMRNTST